MAFDAIKLLLDHFYRHIHIVQMTLLVSFILPRIGVNDFVVIEVFDWKQRQYVRRDCGCRVQDLLPLSGSAWNSSLKISVFVGAFMHHKSQTLLPKGSATKSYFSPSKFSFEESPGGCVLRSSLPSKSCGGNNPRCSHQSILLNVAACRPVCTAPRPSCSQMCPCPPPQSTIPNRGNLADFDH